jgi:hypothetical protein
LLSLRRTQILPGTLSKINCHPPQWTMETLLITEMAVKHLLTSLQAMVTDWPIKEKQVGTE